MYFNTTGQITLSILSIIPRTKRYFEDSCDQFVACFAYKGVLSTILGSFTFGVGMSLCGAVSTMHINAYIVTQNFRNGTLYWQWLTHTKIVNLYSKSIKVNQSKPQISMVFFNFVDLNFLLIMRVKSIRPAFEKLKLMKKYGFKKLKYFRKKFCD